MLTIVGAHQSVRSAGSMHLTRCWRFDTSGLGTAATFRVSDTQHDIFIREFDGSMAWYEPGQIVFGQTIRRQSGMRPNSTEIHIVLDDAAEITRNTIESGRLDRARVTECHVDGNRPWTGAHAMFRWVVADAQFGGALAVLTLLGLSSHLGYEIGETLTTTCQNKPRPRCRA